MLYLIKRKIDISVDLEFLQSFPCLSPVLTFARVRVGLYHRKIRPEGTQHRQFTMKCNTWESRKVSAILSVYGKRYNHLKLEERDTITVMKSEGKTLSEIAGVREGSSDYIAELQRNFP